MADLDAIIDVLVADPTDTALLFDFDGTLAEIVDAPGDARAAEGVRALLDRLAARFALVAVVSGRPRDFLVDHLGPAITLAGLYGMETRVDGHSADHHDAARWRDVVAGVAAQAQARSVWTDAGVTVENKGLSLTVHHRNAPALAEDIAAWADDVAAASSLEVRSAKQSVELHPEVDVDKGTTLLDLVGTTGCAVYVGDDVGDLPAFAALDDLASRGRRVLRIAVGGDELPPAVSRVADHVLTGPDQLVEILAAVADRSDGPRRGAAPGR